MIDVILQIRDYNKEERRKKREREEEKEQDEIIVDTFNNDKCSFVDLTRGTTEFSNYEFSRYDKVSN